MSISHLLFFLVVAIRSNSSPGASSSRCFVALVPGQTGQVGERVSFKERIFARGCRMAAAGCVCVCVCAYELERSCDSGRTAYSAMLSFVVRGKPTKGSPSE